jgi:hypothetical protein
MVAQSLRGLVGLFFVSGSNVLSGHAFISYARTNSRKVDQLQRTLEAAGVRVWRDTTELSPGEDWRARIRDAITQNALVFIACFSKQSVARMTSYQNEELTLAIDEMRKRSPNVPWLIPVRLDDCDIPDRDIGGGRTLSSIHRADLFGPSTKAGAERLVAVVLKMLGQDLVAPATAEPLVPSTPASNAASKSSGAKRATGTVLYPTTGARPLGDPNRGTTHTNALPQQDRPPDSRVASARRGGMSEPRPRSASPGDLVEQLASLEQDLEGFLGLVDDEPQAMDIDPGRVHRRVGQIWSFAKNQLFDADSPLEGLLPSNARGALEDAYREENDALELYTDDLDRYHRDGRKDRDLLNNRRAYISALRAFQVRVSVTVEDLYQQLPSHE